MFELFYNRDISKSSYDRFIDSFQKMRLYNIDVSINNEIITKTNYITNKLAIDKIDYRYLLCGTTTGSILLHDLCNRSCSENDSNNSHQHGNHHSSSHVRSDFDHNNSITIDNNDNDNNNKHTFKPILEYCYSQFMNRNSSTSAPSSSYGSIISSLQWYPEDSGAFIASTMSGHVSIFDTNLFSIVMDFKFPDNIVYCSKLRSSKSHSRHNNTGSSSSSSPLIAVGLHDCTIRLCDPRTQDMIHCFKGGHYKQVTCIEWNPICDHQILSSDMNGVMKIWDIRRSGIQALVCSFDWREDFNSNNRGSRSSSSSSTSSNVGHTLSHQISSKNMRNSYNDSSRSSSNKDNLSSSSSVDLIRIQARSSISAATHQHIAASRAHDGGIMSIQYSSCGRYIVSAGNDGKLRLWNTQTNTLARHIAYTNIVDDSNIPSSSSSSSVINTINSTNIVPICNLPYDICMIEFQSTHDDIVIVPSAPSSTLSSSSSSLSQKKRTEGNMLMIPLHSLDGKPIRILKGHFDRVTSIIYRQPYQQIITCSKDGMIFLWDASDNNNNNNKQYYKTNTNHHNHQHQRQKHHQQLYQNIYQQNHRDDNNTLRHKDSNIVAKDSKRPGSYDFQNILKTFKIDNNNNNIDDTNSSVDNWSDDDENNDGNVQITQIINNQHDRLQIDNQHNCNSNVDSINNVNSKPIHNKKRKRNEGYVPPIILKYLEDSKRALLKIDNPNRKQKINSNTISCSIDSSNKNNDNDNNKSSGSSSSSSSRSNYTVRDTTYVNHLNTVGVMNPSDFRWDRVDDLFNQQPTELESNLLDSTELNRHRITLDITSSPSITTTNHNNSHTQHTSSSSSSSMNLHDNKPNSSYKEWIKKTKLNRSTNKNKSK
jgi:WD40 repeat protein